MSDRDPLRDVPFRLSKKFYPLIRPQFRDIDIHIPLDALEEEYDFSLERQMVVKYDAFVEEKERLRIRYEERCAAEKQRLEELAIAEKQRQEELAVATALEAAAEAERMAQLLIEQAKLEVEAPAIVNETVEGRSEEQPENRQPDKEKVEQELPTPNNQTPANSAQPSHKEPIPFAIPMPENRATPGGTRGIQSQNPNAPRKFNVRLSDFEADTANPFDSVELKSMNDKAELASIWSKVLQDQQKQAYTTQTNRSSAPTSGSASPYPAQQFQNPAPPWENPVPRYPNGSLYYQPARMAPSSSPVPQLPANVRPTSNNGLNSPPTTIESSLNNSTGIRANAMPPSQETPSAASVSSANSFTKLHFPFLSSYTQANTRDRELERSWERSYHQHYQQQQNISSSAPPSAVPGTIGFNPAVIQPGPVLSSSTSASNLQNIPNNFHAAANASGTNSSHNIQNQAHNNFIIGHNYNWPLTTTHTPPYEYSHVQQTAKK